MERYRRKQNQAEDNKVSAVI